MADSWSQKKRSDVMSKIRKTDSMPELIMRAALRQARIPFRTYANLPGTPDVVIDSAKLAVFINGCFWHGCPHHYRSPHSNVQYWSAKLERNRARDRSVRSKARRLGWRTMVIWECELKKDPPRVVERLVKRLERIDAASEKPRDTP